MRGFIAATFIVLLLYTPPASSQASIQSELAEAIRQVVAINREAGRFARRGTAFHTGGGVFYTNAHVAKAKLPEGFTDLYLASSTSTRYIDSFAGPARPGCVHKRWLPRETVDPTSFPYDVATLVVEKFDGLPVFKFADARPLVGQRVRLAGFPSASRAWPPILYVALGRITAIDYSQQRMQIDIESGFALEGSSGSPVLNDQDEVIGIVYSRQGAHGSGAAERMFAVHLDAMKSVCE